MTNCNNCGQSTDYNGWTNFETWCVRLWLDNDPGSYEAARHMAQTYRDLGYAAEAFRDYVGELNPLEGTNSLFVDLLSGALSVVNWREIAESFLED